MFKNIESDDKTKYDTSYSQSKLETNINESDIDDVFESIYTTILLNIHKGILPGRLGTILSDLGGP